MKKIFLTNILFLTIQVTIYAQKERVNWYFGHNAGMTWNKTQTIGTLNGLPTPLRGSQMSTTEGCFILSDPNGVLLMYSNGITIWNGMHEVIADNLSGDWSSAQSGIIVPFPDHPNQYIVFTISLNFNQVGINKQGNKFTYTIIDLSQPTSGGVGFGKVVNGFLDVPMNGTRGTLGECVAAVKHSNGKDYWIVTIGKGANTTINAWIVNSNGVSNNPVKITSTSIITDVKAGSNGYLRFSPDGRYFIWPESTSQKTIIGNFNATNGMCSNIKVLDNTTLGFYGVEFSKSGNVLYLCDLFSIRAYQTTVLFASSNPNNVNYKNYDSYTYALGALQRGPDDRIYAAVQNSKSGLLVIDNADNYGNYSINYINGLITGTGTVQIGLPSFLSSPITPWFYITIDGDSACCRDESKTFSVNLSSMANARKVSWQFGDGTAVIFDTVFTQSSSVQKHTYTNEGIYHITVEIYDLFNNIIAKTTKIVNVNFCTRYIYVNPHIRGYYK
ncbi:MAG: PKD domain-containing protein [Prevotella sp.]|jgi:hypothetical protein|nr:PKD domain-containing protein [Prevotella sp.]